jgi:hypothetical protein
MGLPSFRHYSEEVLLPEVIVDRIMISVRTVLPEGMIVKYEPPKVMSLFLPAEAAAAFGRSVRVAWTSMVGVRNRDGVNERSVAWATWMVLDSIVRMSRSTGVPWPREQAQSLHAYALPVGDRIESWVADDAGFRADVPPIDIAGLNVRPPSGARLPFPLLAHHRLPKSGPVTDPSNAKRR